MQIDPVFLTVSVIITAALAAYFAWASNSAGRVKALAQIVQLTEVIRFAVQQADTLQHMTDEEKYIYVAKEAAIFLSDRGIKIPEDTIRQLIEGAVKLIHRAQNNQTG